MSINVTFLKKQYTFPKDILTYIDILNMAEDIQKELFKSFLDKVSRSHTPVISNEQLHDDMKKQAGRFIEKLCENEIYDKTVDEYVFENNGYEAYSELNKEGVQIFAGFLSEEIMNLRDGMNNAEINAASNITGSGIQVYTSSFLTLAATSAMEYSILKKQCKEADKQYRNEIKVISDRGAAIRADKEKIYLENNYIPGMEKAITLFSFEMMDKYIRHLTEAGKFDVKALDYVNIKKSVGLLENLNHTSNKLAVYEQSFLACPYNFNLYQNLIESDILDKETFLTAKKFGQGSEIINSLKSKIFNVDCQYNLTDALKYINKYITIYADCTNTSEVDICHKVANKKYLSVKEGYNSIKSKISNSDDCCSLIQVNEGNIGNISKDYIVSIAKEEVNHIISDKDFDTLRNACGYTDLLNEITPKNQDFANKLSLDTFYINELVCSITKYVDDCKDKLIKKKEQSEAIARESAKQVKRNGIIITVIIVFILLIILYVKVIHPQNTYNSGINAMNSKNYSEAIAYFESLEDYSDSEKMILECKYREANNYYQFGNYNEAINIFKELGNYSDAEKMILECKYREANDYYQSENYDEAIIIFKELGNYSESNTMLMQAKYNKAEKLLELQNYQDSIIVFEEILNYKDSAEKIKSAYLGFAEECFRNEDYLAAIETMKKADSENIDFFDKCYYEYGNLSLERHSYRAARDAFSKISTGDYSETINYINCMLFYNSGDYISAIEMAEKCQNPDEKIITDSLEKIYDLNEEAIQKNDYDTMIKCYEILSKYDYKDSKEKYNEYKKLFDNISGTYVCTKYTGDNSNGKNAYLIVSTNYRNQAVSISFYPFGNNSKKDVAKLVTSYNQSGGYSGFEGDLYNSLTCRISDGKATCRWAGETYIFEKN